MPLYQTDITVRVLSDRPVENPNDLEAIAREGDSGDYVLAVTTVAQAELTREQMDVALTAAGSDPGFFEDLLGEAA